MGNLLGLVLVDMKDVSISGTEVSVDDACGYPMKRSKGYSVLPGLEIPPVEVSYRDPKMPIIFENDEYGVSW